VQAGEAFAEKLVAPGDDVALHDRREAIAAIGGLDKLAEAVEVEGNLGGDLLRADAVEGEGEVD
jgi:hypothetical protein